MLYSFNIPAVKCLPDADNTMALHSGLILKFSKHCFISLKLDNYFVILIPQNKEHNLEKLRKSNTQHSSYYSKRKIFHFLLDFEDLGNWPRLEFRGVYCSHDYLLCIETNGHKAF